jgi:hypothetical protein
MIRNNKREIMQKESTGSAHSQAHPIAALSQDGLAQQRTAIVALLNNHKRLRERFADDNGR